MPPKAAEADIVFVFFDTTHLANAVHEFVRVEFPKAAIIGGTCARGVFSDQGFSQAHAIGMIAIIDPAGCYGVASSKIGDDPGGAARMALSAALERSGCEGELPELIWIYQAQGREECVVEGLRSLVGDRCAIVGGSAANHPISGLSTQMSADGVHHDHILVGVLFPSTSVSYAYGGAYHPTGPSGVVTDVDEVNGTRRIVQIDGEPAALVYNRWVGDALADVLSDGGPIEAHASQSPLAVDMKDQTGLTHYLVIHPTYVDADHALHISVKVTPGARINAMEADDTPLSERLASVARLAKLELEGAAAVGAIFIVGAACEMEEAPPQTPQHFRRVLGGAPYLGGFTFGEQGALMRRNLHGNLMISAILFGAEHAS